MRSNINSDDLHLTIGLVKLTGPKQENLAKSVCKDMDFTEFPVLPLKKVGNFRKTIFFAEIDDFDDAVYNFVAAKSEQFYQKLEVINHFLKKLNSA